MLRDAEMDVQMDENNRNVQKNMDNENTDDTREGGRDAEQTRTRKPAMLGEAVICRPLEVSVRDARVEQAIRQLKNRLAREGILRELKNRRHFCKPSELKRIKSREAARRRRKTSRQRPN